MRLKPRYKRGDKIGGHYLVHQALMGGMGEVYLCLELETIRPFALKTFQSRYLTNPKLRAAFNTEVATWVALEKHPNIVRCFFMEMLDNHPFMLLEWIASDKSHGTDLRSWLRHGPLGMRLALDFTIDICHGLIHAGQKQPGVVHRDLKPENILVSQRQIAKITDFGLAKIVQAAGLEIFNTEIETDGRQNLSNLGGTPPYMAPEQWSDGDLDPRTDIYAVGCILYEMLTGRWPFNPINPTTEDFRRQHLEATIPRPSEGNNLPVALDTVMSRCLAKRKDERFATVDDLLQQLSLIYENQFNEAPNESTPGREFTAEDYTNRGVTYMNLKRYDNALVDLNRAIELEPSFAAAYVNRGATYSELHRYDEALADLDRAIRLDRTLTHAYANRGTAYEGLGRYEEALVDYGTAIELNPTFAGFYSIRGHTYSRLAHYEEALTDLHRAIQMDPTSAYAYTIRSFCLAGLGRHEEALSDLSRAIQLDPIDAKSYGLRGRCLRELRRYDEALADLNYAIELDDKNALVYHDRGLVYEHLQRPEEALQDYTSAVQLDPTHALTFYNRGIIYENLQRYEEALADDNRAIELDASHALAYNNRGLVYDYMQRYDEALADYNRAIELDPALALPYHNRGETLLKLQHYEEALADYNRAIQLDPDYMNTYVGRGTAYSNLGRYDEALSDYGAAAKLDPTLALVYNNRASVYVKLKRYQEALEVLDQAIGLNHNPGLAYSYYLRGAVHSELQRPDEALADYTRSIELDPDFAPAYYNYGVLLFQRNLWRESLAYIEKAAQLGHPQGPELGALLKRHIEVARDAAVAYYNRGVESNNKQRYDEALADYTQAIKIDPGYAPAYANRGCIYTDLQRYDEALADLSRSVQLDPTLAPAYLNLGVVLLIRGALRDALQSFEKAAQLGLPQGTQYVELVRQNLGIAPDPKGDPTRLALEAFLQAGSLDEMRRVATEFPFLTEPDFIQDAAQGITQQVMPEDRSAFEQGLSWLRQIADEQKPEE
jgi:tetratricopeptide (TPR) repeat protein